MKVLFTAILCASSLVWLGPAAADPWKDESGKSWRGGYESGPLWRDERGEPWRRYGRRYRPPRGHAPPPGECRIWYPDRPPGQQPPPFRC